ncbi:MAG: hypothetical protein RBS57_01525, partial [Desulforhabdus sp.]|nr:hypothetical protein [Desulforhabdus sp.]
MKHWLTKCIHLFCTALVFSCCWMKASDALGGPLRINLTDGKSVEVPYYWEEKGEIKFEMPGGVAGIPKAYVRSVQEIVTTREFDPEVMLESTSESSTSNRDQVLLDLAEKHIPSPSSLEKISSEASLALLDTLNVRDPSVSAERIHGPIFSRQGDFTELVRLKGDGLMLMMQNILTSREELSNRRFSLTLY